MNKEEFFNKLNRALADLPLVELRKANTYYSELIDDYTEDGMTEEEAVKKVGNIEEIVEALLSESGKAAKNTSKRKSPLTVIFLILGFPLWGSLLLAGFLLFLSFFILFYCPLIILWSCSVGFLAASLIAVLISPFLFISDFQYAVFQLGAVIALIGISIILLVFTKQATKWTVSTSKIIWKKTLRLFRKGGNDNV